MNGIHAIIEANGPISTLSACALLELMTHAATAAGAIILQKHVHEFGENAGHTGVLLLAESHISVHTWPEHNYAAFDIFMCGEPHLQRALDVLRAANPSGSFHTKILPRGRESTARMQPKEIAESLLVMCPQLSQHLQTRFSTTEQQVTEGLSETIKYLLLQSQTQATLCPSSAVFKIWQELVLFTECYEQLCHQYLSHFIHFQPTLNICNSSVGYHQTIKEYEAQFGPINKHFWDDSETRPNTPRTEFTPTIQKSTL